MTQNYSLSSLVKRQATRQEVAWHLCRKKKKQLKETHQILTIVSGQWACKRFFIFFFVLSCNFNMFYSGCYILNLKRIEVIYGTNKYPYSVSPGWEWGLNCRFKGNWTAWRIRSPLTPPWPLPWVRADPLFLSVPHSPICLCLSPGSGHSLPSLALFTYLSLLTA